MLSFSRSYFSISKLSGALKPSRYTASYSPTKSKIASTTSSGLYLLSIQIGTASTSPIKENKRDFPSRTGRAERGPIDPNPEISDPSVTIAQSFLNLFPWSSCEVIRFFSFLSVKCGFIAFISEKFN